MRLSTVFNDISRGKRISLIKWKSGRTVTSSELCKIPGMVDFYESLTKNVGDIVNEKVFTTNYDQSTTCSMLIYEKEGDFINWHYDVNYFRGRFFTLIIPITLEKTCTDFKYKLNGEEYFVEHGKSILFEGEKLFHMASKQCDGKFRAVLALQYVTSNEIDFTKLAFLQTKDSFVYKGFTTRDYAVWLVRLLHTTIYFLFAFYIFVFTTPKYDMLYIILFLIILLNWILFRGECILDYVEKVLMNSSYKIGTSIYDHVYLNIIHPKLIILLNILVLINIVMIIWRARNLNIVWKVILIVIISTLILRNEIINRSNTMSYCITT
jgi:hypothetical protein